MLLWFLESQYIYSSRNFPKQVKTHPAKTVRWRQKTRLQWLGVVKLKLRKLGRDSLMVMCSKDAWERCMTLFKNIRWILKPWELIIRYGGHEIAVQCIYWTLTIKALKLFILSRVSDTLFLMIEGVLLSNIKLSCPPREILENRNIVCGVAHFVGFTFIKLKQFSR